MTVWLARHGAVAHGGLAVGWSDPPLSAEGRRQARALAGQLTDQPLRHVLSSDLRRARATAIAIAAVHGLEVITTPDLRELSFGAWEGRRLAELWTERPEEAAAWEEDLRALPPSFGEDFGAFEARVLRAGARIAAAGGGLVVVSHRGPLAVLHAHLRGISLEASWALPRPPGSVAPVELVTGAAVADR